METRIENLLPVCFTPKPLSKFKEGDRICFRKRFGDHDLLGHGTFVGITKGMVVIKYVPGEWSPDWISVKSFAAKNPGGVVRIKPANCFLWGKRSESDTYDHCLWFVGTTFGVTGKAD